MRKIILEVSLFQWVDAVARKGEAAARLHCGVTAQTVAEAFRAEGLEPARYALFCADALFEAGEAGPGRSVT